jgi:hypothetical protein
MVDERIVIIPNDDRPFTVQQSEMVRRSDRGIASSIIEAKVHGPTKFETLGTLKEQVNGRPLIGLSAKEFDLRPTSSGGVTVTLTVSPLQVNAEPKVRKREFDVK